MIGAITAMPRSRWDRSFGEADELGTQGVYERCEIPLFLWMGAVSYSYTSPAM